MSTTGNQKNLYHRQPLGYGPASGPRQDLFTEESYTTWGEAGMHLGRIVYSTEASAINALLPAGLHVEEGVEATVMFEVMNLKNLPWLAGRGYNTTGIYFNNIIHEGTGTRGSYLSVLFESLTDPIITGREELGFPKVFATTSDPVKLADGTWKYTVSWLGHDFMTLTFPNVTQSEAPTARTVAHTSPVVEGFMAYRYMPAIGEPGVADAEYTVYMKGAPKPAKVNAYYIPGKSAEVEITKSTFQELPTLHYIVNKLAELPLKEVREQCIIDQQGASDVASVKRL